MLWLWWFLVWVGTALLAYYLSVQWGWHAGSTLAEGRTLFVTAHPDDECMFFAPTILSLTEKHPHLVYLLCMSCGDYDKQGKVRAAELFASAANLGIPASNVTLMHSTFFPDSPKSQWDVMRLADVISYHVACLDVTVLVSFDDYGVSGHANHRALAMALREMKLPSNCRAYILDSVNFVRKYISFLDLVPTFLTGLFIHVASPKRRSRALRAMAAHKSQMVWFRRLYLYFSRYMLINSFTELTDELSLIK